MLGAGIRGENETSPASVLMDHSGSWERGTCSLKVWQPGQIGKQLVCGRELESELWSVEWTENTLDIQGGEYNGPLNSVGVRDSNPCTVENSHIVFNSPKTGRIGSRTNCGYQYLQML